MSSIVRFDELASSSRERVGGKAASVGRLAAAGFAVPEAFAIPVDTTVRLRGTVDSWPADVLSDLREAHRALVGEGPSAVAVRSSAVDEDSETASFAGQHETVLDVVGEAALLEAISACLDSLYSPAAVAYRDRTERNVDPQMAILVQRMVHSRIAGVAFSVDPVTGDSSRVLVEAVAGRGDVFVAGQAEGDRVVLGRDGLAVLEQHHPGEPVLTSETARLAAEAVLRAEDVFGSPQDIEFAVAEDGTVWLLQSRPITTEAAALAAGGWVSEFDTPTSGDELWTSANVQEVLPSILTPLTMSTFEEYVHKAYTAGYQRLRALDRDEWPQFVGIFYSRAFLNVGATRLIAERVIGGDPDGVEHRFLGGELGGGASRQRPAGVWKYRLRTILPMLRMAMGIHKAGARIDHATRTLEREVRADDVERMTDAAIGARRRQLSEFVAETFQVHLQASGCAAFGFETVAKTVRPMLGDDAEGILPGLFTGMRDVESAQISLDLWELSRLAIREGVAAALREPAFDPVNDDLPEGWRAAFRAFIDRHGHRGLNEMEPAAPNWRQDPAPAIAIVRSFLDLPEEQSPLRTLERQEQERVRLTQDLERRMNPVKRRVFRYNLRQAQGWVSLRERTKSVIVRGTRLVDFYLPEAGGRLVSRGVLDEPSDIFFLSTQELDGALAGAPCGDCRPRIARRKREMERNRHVVLPERFYGHPVPLEPDLSHHSGDVLTGTPVSPGLITGRARVILDPTLDGPMQPGEILVAPVTDAGWTPLFSMASGLVVDMGSALSHGSTVAREYGLPAVVNVRRGTRNIRTGDLIQVNGNKGTVTILEEVPAAPSAT